MEVLFTAYSVSIDFSNPSNLKLYTSQQALFMAALVFFAVPAKLVLPVVVCNRA
jgi:hypothetical protein